MSVAAGAAAGRAVVVFNTMSAARPGLARITLDFAEPGTEWISLASEGGAVIAFLAEGVRRHRDSSLAGLTLTFRADSVPALGYRTYWVTAAPLPDGHAPDGHARDGHPPGHPAGWVPAGSATIENEAFLIEADPAMGGTLSRILDKRSGHELVTGRANELVIQEEYDYHPKWNEGPWLLTPKGPGTGSAGRTARVRAERCPIGTRLVAELDLDELRITQETLLWDGASRIEFRTHADGSIGSDRLLRVRFPAVVPGALPVYQSALSVIGRPFGSTDTDVAEHWYTLDNPAHEWFGLSSAARVALTAPSGERLTRAIGVAEVICPMITGGSRAAIRALLVALASQFGAEKPVKIYAALVRGEAKQREFDCEAKLAPHPLQPANMRVDSRNGQRARTEFTVRETFEGYLLLECRPRTGPTQQIRAHLKHLRLPIVGDDIYGGPPLWLSTLKPQYRLKPGRSEKPLISRVALHAEQLIIRRPGADENASGTESETANVRLEAPWPKDLSVAVKYLRRYAGQSADMK